MCTYAQAGQSDRTSGGTAASGPGKAADLSGVSTRLPQGGGPDQGEPEIFVPFEAAGLPARHDLDRYDFTRTEGIDSRKLRELRELVWVGQAYNLLLAGGSGTGKTYIAAGLVHEAVKAGYRAYMVTLEDLLTCLKTRDVSRHAMKTYKRIMKAQLLAIDNATLFPLKREDIMLLFKLVNEFQEKTSLIVTANYSLTEWLAIPGEEAVAAALLDRLLYCCEIIQLSRNSYRMENRKTIFSNRSEDTDTLKELTTVK